MDAFERYVSAGLELAGDSADEAELAVMRAADSVYGDLLRALLESDVAAIATEPDLDPARPPRPR